MSRASAAERERYMRAWVASGGPARAAALRKANGLPPVPSRVRREWARYIRTTPYNSVAASRRPADQGHVAELRERARTLFWLDDQRMLARGRRALAQSRTEHSAMGFELSGDPDAFSARRKV
jgi:hypothetical protein